MVGLSQQEGDQSSLGQGSAHTHSGQSAFRSWMLCLASRWEAPLSVQPQDRWSLGTSHDTSL